MIRLGTKALSYWPFRFLTDPDSDDLMRLFERIALSGKHLAIQAHNSHYHEFETPEARAAIRRIRMTGAVIRCQSPCVRYVNDSPQTWARMWTQQVRLGCVPYYMFIARSTGPEDYFRLSAARLLDIYTDALKQCSGLIRTARGPSKSMIAGKLGILGTSTIQGQKVFALKFFQARNPAWLEEVFYAKYDPEAELEQLKPAFADEFPYVKEMARVREESLRGFGSSGQRPQFYEGHASALLE